MLDCKLSFPPGLTVFGLQGGIPSFLHGGLSLQECVIAFLKGIPSARPNKVEVKMLLPERITSRVILVRLRAEASSILDRPRKVLVTVGEKTSEVREMSPRSAQYLYRSSRLTSNFMLINSDISFLLYFKYFVRFFFPFPPSLFPLLVSHFPIVRLLRFARNDILKLPLSS